MNELTKSHKHYERGNKKNTKIISKTNSEHFERLCFDGTDQDTSIQVLDKQEFNSYAHQKDLENTNTGSETDTVQSNDGKNVPAESYQFQIPKRCNFSKALEEALAGKHPSGITRLKDSLKINYLKKLFDENFILEQIDNYLDNRKKKAEIVSKQKELINIMRKKKVKKPTVHKKFFQLNLKRPKKKEHLKGISPDEKRIKQTGLSDLSKKGTETIEFKDETSEDEEIRSVSKDSISCPSETDGETCCKCSNECTCNEYDRFLTFSYKKQERDLKQKRFRSEQKRQEVNEGVRWVDFEKLYALSPVSSESCSQVSSISSSNCSIVRMCHCNQKCCGCSQYRDYLKYKLYQVKHRKRKRQRDREKNSQNINKMVHKYYEEHEYIQKVKQFIDEHFIARGTEAEKSSYCTCGLYNCKCRKAELEGSVENDKIDTESSNDREFKSVQCNMSDESSIAQEDDKHTETWDSMDFYEKLAILIDKNDGDFTRVNVNDVINSAEPLEKEIIKPSHDDSLSWESFDDMDNRKCNCKDNEKYYNHYKKIRRSVEKKDPFAKYFRKRIVYVLKMITTRKMLNETSSDTDEPVFGPLTSHCEKYAHFLRKSSRRQKILKKKKHKLEKKALGDIIFRGSHMFPCVCLANKRKSAIKLNDLQCICKEEGSQYKIKGIKTKIDPSLSLEHVTEKDLIFGLHDTFPDCPVCKKQMTVHFTEGKLGFAEMESYHGFKEEDAKEGLDDQVGVNILKPDSEENVNTQIDQQNEIDQSQTVSETAHRKSKRVKKSPKKKKANKKEKSKQHKKKTKGKTKKAEMNKIKKGNAANKGKSRNKPRKVKEIVNLALMPSGMRQSIGNDEGKTRCRLADVSVSIFDSNPWLDPNYQSDEAFSI